MNCAKLARALAAGALLLAGCGGTRLPSQRPKSGPVSADAPSWARDGDVETDEGTLFVCEGEGSDEAQAVDAARALCSAKICEQCGVEVKAITETHETLDKVDVERKVVETCRRVRTSAEDVRYRQAGCGPAGCRAFLQVFFGREAEARECRAYADGNYADSGQCEALIEQFRSTRGLTAASFRARAALLSQAVVACAEIDVRPTPKLTALDEILWQGVVTPRAEERQPQPLDKAAPIAARLGVLAQNRADAWKSEYSTQAYAPIERQPLLETKVFVERIAQIRDAMLGYASIMTLMETVVDTEHAPDAAHDAALVRELRGLLPVAGRTTPERVLAWAADEISRNPRTLRLPGLKAYLMETYPVAPEAVGHTLLRAFAIDGRAADDEWRYATKEMRGCLRCAASLLALPEHGSEATRVARVAELSRQVSTDTHVHELQDLDPALLLRAEPALDAGVAARVFTYAWFRRWLEKLPSAGRDTTPWSVHEEYGGDSGWRWTVSPQQHKDLAVRAFRLLQTSAPSMRCDHLDDELSLLERHGADTRPLEATLCGCVAAPSSSGMRDVVELYQRLVAWAAPCVGKVSP